MQKLSVKSLFRHYVRIWCVVCFFGVCSLQLFAQTKPASQRSEEQELNRLFNDAVKAVQGGNLQGGLQNFSAILQRKPNDAAALSNRALVYFQMNNLPAALQDITKAIALNPKNYVSYLIKGATEVNLQRYDEAIKDLTVYLKFNPKDASGYENRARAFLRKGLYAESIKDFTAAISLTPKNAALYLDRGTVKYQLKDSTVEQDLQMALRLEPNYYDAYFNLVQLYKEQNRFSEAQQMLKKMTVLRPTEMLNYTMLGYIAFKANDDTEALAAFTEVLRRDANNIKALGYRAFVHYRLKKYQEALADCRQYFTLNANDIALTRSQDALVSVESTLDKGVATLSHADLFAVRGMTRRKLSDKGWYADIRKALLLGQTVNIIALLSDAADDAHTLARGDDTSILQTNDWNFPEQSQFYARQQDDSVTVSFSATVRKTCYDSVYIRVYKNNLLVRRYATPLMYKVDAKASMEAVCALQARIHAEKSFYRFELGLKSAAHDTIALVRDSILCGDVYLVSGQSNVTFGERYIPREHQYLRTFSASPQDNFWHIPAFEKNTLANVVGEELLRSSNVPIAVINGGMGGTNIAQHLPKEPRLNPSSLYGRLATYMSVSGLAQYAKALIWYQGESDIEDKYAQKFDALYRAWKQDYPNLKHIYAVQTRPSDCGQPTQDILRETQRNLGRTYPDIVPIASAALPSHDGCHYGNQGYITLGQQLARLINRDFYTASDTIGIASPNLRTASWTSTKHDEIALEFETNDKLRCGVDTLIAAKTRNLASDGFLLDNKPVKALSVKAEKNTVLLKLSSTSAAKTISYIPEKCYVASLDAPCVVYQGPWITTERGVGALTFSNVVIK
jgi:tetratricopeptide (TPR) repeat protein